MTTRKIVPVDSYEERRARFRAEFYERATAEGEHERRRQSIALRQPVIVMKVKKRRRLLEEAASFLFFLLVAIVMGILTCRLPEIFLQVWRWIGGRG